MSVGSEISRSFKRWINHNVTSYPINHVCNPFLHLRDPSEELVHRLGIFLQTLLIMRNFPPGTFSTETYALLSFESRVIYSRCSRDTFNIVKFSIKGRSPRSLSPPKHSQNFFFVDSNLTQFFSCSILSRDEL